MCSLFFLSLSFLSLSLSLTPKEEHDQEVSYLTSLSSTIHEITRQSSLSHPNSADFAVCLSTGVKTYGGFGNFVGSLVTATVISLMTQRVLIINNYVLLSMFQHPDTDTKTDTRQTFLSYEITPRTDVFCSPSCPGMMDAIYQTRTHIIGVNRCNQAVAHDPKVKEWYSKTFHFTFQPPSPKTWTVTENIIHYDILHWLLSKPTPKWEEIIKARSIEVYKNCTRDGGEHHRANLALQVRSFADLLLPGQHIAPKRLKCYVDCAIHRAEQLHQHHNHDVCVLVTSDNSQLTDQIIGELAKLPYVTAVHNDYPEGATLSHSGNLLLEHRDDKTFSLDKIKDHPEFVDWMLLSEAESAIYTMESTFALTARNRAGPLRAKDDHAVRMIDSENCVCEAVGDEPK